MPESAHNSDKAARVERLKPHRFAKGTSGNPGGRPKAVFSDAMSKAITSAEALKLVRAMIKKAAKGDVKAFETLANRLEGKPVEQVRIEGQMQVSVTVDL